MSKALYRLNGEPERDVHKVDLFAPKGMARAPEKAECKLFAPDEVEEARKRGWVSHAAMMDFLFLGGDADQGKHDAKGNGEGGAKGDGDDKEIDLTTITDKTRLEAIGREHGVEVDKRKSLEFIRTQIAEAIAAKAGEAKK